MNTNTIKARVIEACQNRYTISTSDGEFSAVLSGRLLYNENYAIVGDYVDAVISNQGDSLIVSIDERKTYISRPDRSGHSDGFVKTLVEQAMVANIDYFFIVTSLNNDFSSNRIARYAATAIAGGAIPVAILTKADLCENPEIYADQVRELTKNLEVHIVSSYTGYGLDSLEKFFQPGITIALMGSSGAGKSTLINTIAGKEIMKVSEIREDDSKGRHTTTHRQLIDVNGTYIIDTPGMRELGVGDVSDALEETFDDIHELEGCCRFSDCSHSNEPGCAIKRALENGTLTQERWNVYSRLQAESSRARKMKAQFMINVSKSRKELKKMNKLR